MNDPGDVVFTEFQWRVCFFTIRAATGAQEIRGYVQVYGVTQAKAS